MASRASKSNGGKPRGRRSCFGARPEIVLGRAKKRTDRKQAAAELASYR